MKIFFLSITFVTTIATSSAQCDACLDGACHTKTLVWNRNEVASQMTIDRTTNTLYFQYRPGFINVALNLEDLSYYVIRDNVGEDILYYTGGRAVDFKTRDLYLGTSRKGMFKYSPYTNQTELLGGIGESMLKLWFREKIYYSRYSGICYLENEIWSCVSPLRDESIDDFVVDKNDDIYWRNSARHYRFETARYETKYLFTHRFAEILTNIHEEVYYIAHSVVTKLNYDTDEIVDVGIVQNANIYYADFDKNNNLVYYDLNNYSIYKLQLNQEYNCNVSSAVINSWKN